ncbi:MAG: AMIN-like domain-containing (lipo)protein [Gaiellaceae bacterium]
MAAFSGRSRLCGLALLAAGLVLAGCGGSSKLSASTETTGPTTTATNGIDTLAGASTVPVEGKAQIQGTALLERVELARHEGYDRVVFQFRNGLPGYHIAYAEAPLHEDGSGKTVPVAGNYFVVVRMEPASGFDLSTGGGKPVYTGPRRLAGSGAGTSEVSEIVRTGDFEAVLTWAVGLVDRVDFRVTTLSDPARLVVDFRNH